MDKTSSTGRNFDEIKRLIIALQKADKDGGTTPADWEPGDEMTASYRLQGPAELLKSVWKQKKKINAAWNGLCVLGKRRNRS